jgi:protein-S-isoprenylcysteine O-methyltransferase Ste14
MVLISQYWLSLVAGVIVVITWTLECHYADERLINKFGEEYRIYMEKVPGINLFLGIYRKLIY